MVLVGEPAMVEAVRTTASTFGIWAIVAVAMICLAAWLISVYVADSQQTRMSRLRRRMDAPGPALSETEGSAAASIPGQRRAAGQPEPTSERAPASQSASAATTASQPGAASASETVAARGRHARPPDYYAAADYYEAADYKAAETPPAGNAETRPRGVGGTEADGGAGGGQADAPTRPDLPAQAAPTGRHAMPSQRSGDSDRAERAHAGTDADHQDDQDQR
jgi:hypothetical protein